MEVQAVYVISDKTEALNDLCFGARKLCDKVTAFVFGDETLAKSVSACGAEAVIFCPAESSPEDYSKAIASEIKKSGSALVMVSNTIRGRLMAGKIGAYLNSPVLSNVSAAAIEDGKLKCKRTVYGGAALSTEVFTSAYGVVTLGSGVWGDIDAAYPETSQISEIDGKAQDTLKCVARNEKKEGTVNLAAAKRIVDVGRGLASEEDLVLCKKLASVLDAEVGCSRPVAENNKWMPKSCYLGVTGVVVKPELCFTIGVSGQVQHIAGIDKSKVIVAVNKDKNAPIFKNADFGIAGDLYKILPALIDKLS